MDSLIKFILWTASRGWFDRILDLSFFFIFHNLFWTWYWILIVVSFYLIYSNLQLKLTCWRVSYKMSVHHKMLNSTYFHQWVLVTKFAMVLDLSWYLAGNSKISGQFKHLGETNLLFSSFFHSNAHVFAEIWSFQKNFAGIFRDILMESFEKWCYKLVIFQKLDLTLTSSGVILGILFLFDKLWEKGYGRYWI